MNEPDDRIDRTQERMAERWDGMDQSAREEVRKTLNELRKQRNDLREWFGGLKHSSESAWGQVKEGFIESYGKLADAFSKAEKEFSSGDSGKSGD